MAARKRGKGARARASQAADPPVVETSPSPERTSSTYAPWLAVALAALTLVVYAGVWSFDFVHFDDPEYIVRNQAIAHGFTWTSIQWAFTTGYAANWHPITWLSHMLDVQLFGLRGGPPHLVNLLLHIGSTLLLFWFLSQATGAAGRSAVVAALFAVHPLHVESVAWVSERKDVLSTAFWMLTLCAYVSWVRRPDRRRYGIVMASFAVGLMAKQMLVTLPFVMLLLDVWPLGRLSQASARPWGPRAWLLVREKIPLFALAAGASAVTYLAQSRGGLILTLQTIPLGLRMENVLVSYAGYVAKMVWPARLYMFYPLPESVPAWETVACAVFLMAVTTAAVFLRRSRPYVAVGWFWYLGTLVPVIGFVKIGGQAMADRYTYIPLVGLFIAIVWGAADFLARWPARLWLAPTVAGLVVAPCAFVARAQVQHWRNDSALWSHALQTSIGLDERRASIAVDDLAAEESYGPMQALLLAKDHGGTVFPPLARDYLGRMFARHNQLDEAVVSFSEAVQLAPTVADFHSDLAGALARQGKIHEALPHFAETARLRPDSADAHRNLALALADTGRMDDAMREFREVLRLKPDDANVRRLLDEYARRGKPPQMH